MLAELVVRFLVGGAIVSAFSLLGDVFKPKSFAGLFGAAPSVALATLALAVAVHGPAYGATEGRSMIAGAVALCVYCLLTCRLLAGGTLPTLLVTLLAIPGWFAVAFGIWFVALR